nr:putative zinc finger A20 and AN1 domain-containing stress-associated protein 8 [Tanacetum cinerariifolium]
MPSMKEELDQSTTPPLCKTDCGFYVNKETGGFCSSCYKADVLKNKASSQVPKILGVNNNEDNQEPVENHDQSNEVVKKRNRCYVCNKHVWFVPFSCWCGESFCGLHRIPKKHSCKFNFKAAGRVVIEKHNPLCVADNWSLGYNFKLDPKYVLMIFLDIITLVLLMDAFALLLYFVGRICLNFIFLLPSSGRIRRTKANLEKHVLTWSPKAKSCPCGQS